MEKDENVGVNMSHKVHVNLDYDEKTNQLPLDRWTEMEIFGITEKHNLENEAVKFALGELELTPIEWPNIIYTSLEPPKPGACIKRHSLIFE